MFPDNPFLVAAERFIAASLPLYPTTRTDLLQAISGDIRAEFTGYLDTPPSPFGYLLVRLSYSAGHWVDLEEHRTDIRFGEEQDGPPDVALLMEIRQELPTQEIVDVEGAASELAALVSGSELLGSGTHAYIDHTIRRSSQALDFDNELYEGLRVCWENFVPLDQIHARDWGLLAEEVFRLSCDLAEAAIGQRPPEPIGLGGL